MTNELIEFYREHLKPIIQTMLLERNYQGQGKVDYEEFGRDFDELLNLAVVGMQSNTDEDCISRAELLKAVDTWDKFGCDADTKLVPVKDCYVPYIHYDDVVKAIKGMPSIQPKTDFEHKAEIVISQLRADRERLQEAIKALGEDMRICQKSITDEKVLTGFNMAVALCNKHLAKNEHRAEIVKPYLEKLKAKMQERDEDNGGEPLNAVDKGYHLACEHLFKEIDNLLKGEAE